MVNILKKIKSWTLKDWIVIILGVIILVLIGLIIRKSLVEGFSNLLADIYYCIEISALDSKGLQISNLTSDTDGDMFNDLVGLNYDRSVIKNTASDNIVSPLNHTDYPPIPLYGYNAIRYLSNIFFNIFTEEASL